ncbi:glycoside hydrolase family 29 protein [Mollisia scopiformis]|uniref:alpha-L-fucosidase n=1 Tax=Mollisia scopiformis TaxID=149040 RepID=A0A194XWP5_MOLSC|nr:glycoside hydrolase family 29 protein [Mollisia scopiformis]KUJ24663.1 glycoside hydrolase family 29 protein [Mollisia scopiformis]
MKCSIGLSFVGGYLAGIASASPTTASSSSTAVPTPHYRISPIDGSIIALPTKDQLAFQDREYGVLIHFEMGTYLDIDGCNNVPSLVPDLTLFDPALLNTDQWMDSITALGAKYATLVAKHNCGFTTWPSQVKFQTRDNTTISYNYTIAQSPVAGEDVVKMFTASAEKYGVGHGLYYSTVVNNFLNVQKSEVNDTSWAAGQVRITNETYDTIVVDQLTELWSNYGSLTEIWFDGGYSATQQATYIDMLAELQPDAVIFNACDVTSGDCLTENSVRWVGTESGEAPIENWSTGITNDGGNSTSPYFSPSVCDTTLQTSDRWFYGIDQPLRSIQELIAVYHLSVGRNCLLELDISPDRSGLILASHAARYKQLGDFISSCYDSPVNAPHTQNSSSDDGGYTLTFDYATSIDRIVLMEDQTNGQVIRSYSVFAKIIDDDGVSDGTLDVPWMQVANGTSIGHKRIEIFDEAVTVIEVRVNTTFVDTPVWRSVSVHLCDVIPANTTGWEFTP